MHSSNHVISVLGLAILLALIWVGCNSPQTSHESNSATLDETHSATQQNDIKMKLNSYAPFELTADISHLSSDEKQMLKLLFKAAQLADDIFWQQNIGDKEAFLSKLPDADSRAYASINYGPWDEMDDLKPFVKGFGPKPLGAEFYPHDMSKEEFESYVNPDKTSLYTVIRRNDEGALKTIWYHDAYKDEVTKIADLLNQASELAGDAEFANYLKLRAQALLTDDYKASDLAWLDVKNNSVDLVIGPIENYSDQLFGYKAAYESYILIKDKAWSQKLSRYASFLPQLQTELPVDPEYKKEVPGSDADLNAYDVVYYAGDCNMAGKTIAINLPNDESVQLEKGTRKLQLKNAMKAKFDLILVPIAKKLISPDLQQNITFDAFFSNTMFHEVAHGMGIKNTLDGKGSVRHALKEQFSALEEGKADILGLYLVTRLNEMGEFTETDLMDNYVTFMAGIFRSVRFGAASAHGKANMIRFNYFKERGAFYKNDDGTYSIDLKAMKKASTELTQLILKIQGDGDYDAAKKLVADMGIIPADLQSDLDILSEAGIPVDIIFEQGPDHLNLD